MIHNNDLFEVPNINSKDAHIKELIYDLDTKLLQRYNKELSEKDYICVCSGGTTSSCAKNDIITLDLRRKYSHISFNKQNNIVKIGGGVLMKDLLNYLEKYGRLFPGGLSNLPGAGFILTGGISPMSRRYGLAIDNIEFLKGYLGNGSYFSMSKDSLKEKEIKIWEGIKGAAPFFSIITEIGLKTFSSFPIILFEGFVNKKELIELIQISQSFPENFSFQWMLSENIYAYILAEIKTRDDKKHFDKYLNIFQNFTSLKYKKYKTFNHIKFFPKSLNLFELNPNNHSEVISLLGENLENNIDEYVEILEEINQIKPNKSCYLASQQLGGNTKAKNSCNGYFVHRMSTWKPWIYTSWPKNNPEEKRKAINWMNKSWDKLKKFHPHVHLAQLHNHLNTHEDEVKLAFAKKLTDLKLLKNFYDPRGILPPL